MLAENDKEVVAAAITIPDINQVLKKMKGRLLPLGWWHYLNRKRIIDRCRVGFLGVLPEYQHTGVAAQLYIENFDMAAESRIKWGEPGWILETNHGMNRGLEAMGGASPSACGSTSGCWKTAPSPRRRRRASSLTSRVRDSLSRVRRTDRRCKDRRGATKWRPGG